MPDDPSRGSTIAALLRALDSAVIHDALRECADRTSALDRLQAEPFEFTAAEAGFVLDMPFGSQVRSHRQLLENELASLHGDDPLASS